MVNEADRVAADWLLEHGFSPARVALMMRAEALMEAIDELRPLCEECGARGTRQFSTEGDGNYWLCDSVDYEHGLTKYVGESVPQPALREALATPEPRFCECVDHAQPDGDCRDCAGSGWVEGIA